MLNISIKATSIENTPSLEEYTHKRLNTLEKRLTGDARAYVELERTTNHHKQGDVFRAEIKLDTNGQQFFASVEQEDLYAAIDEAKDMLLRELTTTKDKNDTIFRRGARSVKKMLKGISKRNPFTSKY
jgi:putative sigma-54 modulation protein